MARLHLVEVVLSFLIYFSIQVYRYATQPCYHNLRIVLVCSILYLVLPFVHYFLSRYSKEAALRYSPIQSMVTTVLFTQMVYKANEGAQTGDGTVIILMVLMTLSFFSYS